MSSVLEKVTSRAAGAASGDAAAGAASGAADREDWRQLGDSSAPGDGRAAVRARASAVRSASRASWRRC